MEIEKYLAEIKLGISNVVNSKDGKYKYINVQYENITLENLFEEEKIKSNKGFILTELFHVLQGATVGGKGCTEIYNYYFDNNDLVYKLIDGENIDPFKISWSKNYAIFPYKIKKNRFIPAFYDEVKKIDYLDYEINIDDTEAGKDEVQKLNRRIANGYINNTDVSEYLTKNYEILNNRQFEGKNIKEYNKSWYEYHRPREPIILVTPRIVGRRLMKKPSFAIDNIGYLSKDSVINLIPKETFTDLISKIQKITNQKTSTLNGLNYVLYYLNSKYFEDILTKKRSKKQGDYVNISEKMLQKVIIPFPSLMKKAELLKVL